MMNTQKYYELMNRFEASSLCLLEIEEDGCHIRMEKGERKNIETAAPVQKEETQAVPQPSGEERKAVKAPMVGVYYEAPSPEAAPFVQPGDRVEEGQVLCILEAMKMMNELKSPLTGTVCAVNARNGEMVEYGQVLFEVEPC